ncbi:MAG: hypothetical protein AAF468_11570 [Pseudomonadota bacterium]
MADKKPETARKGTGSSQAGKTGAGGAARSRSRAASTKKPVMIDLKAEPTKGATESKPGDSKAAGAKPEPKPTNPSNKGASQLEVKKTEASKPEPKAASTAGKTTSAEKPQQQKQSAQKGTAKPGSPNKQTPSAASKSGGGSTTPPPRKTADRSGGAGFGKLLVAAVLGGVIALAGAWIGHLAGLVNPIQSSASVETIQDLETRLAAAEARLSAPQSATLSDNDKSALEAAQSSAAGAQKTADDAQSSVSALSETVNSTISEVINQIASLAKAQTELKIAISSGAAGDGAAVSTLSGDIQKLTARLTTLASEVDSLKDRPEATDVDVASLTKPLDDKISTLSSDLAALSSKISAQEAAQGQTAETLAGVQSVVSDLTDAVTKLDELAKKPTGEDKAALAIAASSLKTEIDRGGSFAPQLAALEKLSGGSVDLSPLKASAASGIPTLATLKDQFASLGDKMIDATRPKATGSVIEKLLSNAGTLVKVEGEAPLEGNSTPAIVSRISAALEKADLGAVESEWSALPEVAQSLSSDWIASVRARKSAETLMQVIVDKLISDITPAASNG